MVLAGGRALGLRDGSADAGPKRCGLFELEKRTRPYGTGWTPVLSRISVDNQSIVFTRAA